MIVIGSLAAQLHGVLPTWRAGAIGDVDILGSNDEMEALLAALNRPMVAAGTHTPSKFFIRDADMNRFEFNCATDGPYRTIYNLPDNAAYEWRGFEVMAISPLTQLVLKRAIWQNMPLYKTRLDLDFYSELLGPAPTLTPQHMAVEAAMAGESKRLVDSFDVMSVITSLNAEWAARST